MAIRKFDDVIDYMERDCSDESDLVLYYSKYYNSRRIKSNNPSKSKDLKGFIRLTILIYLEVLILTLYTLFWTPFDFCFE